MTTEAETQSVTAEQIKELAESYKERFYQWCEAEHPMSLAKIDRACDELHTAIDAIAAERDALKAKWCKLVSILEAEYAEDNQ